MTTVTLPATPPNTSSNAPLDFNALLKVEGIEPGTPLAQLARSIYQQESRGGADPRAAQVNHGGALGPMQVIKPTFERMADKGWSWADPEHNARAGIRYLKHLDKLSGGDPKLTAAGYYSGEDGMKAARRGQPRYDLKPEGKNAPNSLQYADQVVGRMGSWGRNDWGRNETGGAGTGGGSPSVFRSDHQAPIGTSPRAAAKPPSSPTRAPLFDRLAGLPDFSTLSLYANNLVGADPATGVTGVTAPPLDAPMPIDPKDPADPMDWGRVPMLSLSSQAPIRTGGKGGRPGFKAVSLLPEGEDDFLRALSAFARG